MQREETAPEKPRVTPGQALAGVLILVSIPLLPFWQGYVLADLWAWFAAPAFGLPALTWGHAAGLTILLRLARWKYRSGVKPEEYGSLLLDAWGTPGLLWLMGRLVLGAGV